MRKSRSSGGFFLCFFLNILLNFEWTVPGFALLGLYLWLRYDWLLWCMIGAFSLFILYVLLWTLFLKLINKGGNVKTEHRENKNPYSQKAYTPQSRNNNR